MCVYSDARMFLSIPALILWVVAFFHFIMIVPVDVFLPFVEGNLLRSGDIRGYQSMARMYTRLAAIAQEAVISLLSHISDSAIKSSIFRYSCCSQLHLYASTCTLRSFMYRVVIIVISREYPLMTRSIK